MPSSTSIGTSCAATGQRIPVEPQVFDVLVHLASHTERVVTKEELLDTVWGDRFVSESALTSRIKAGPTRRRGRRSRARRSSPPPMGAGTGWWCPSMPRAADGTGRARARPAPERSTPGSTRSSSRRRPDQLIGPSGRPAGSGRVVWVAGEAGIGKSTLARRFAGGGRRRRPCSGAAATTCTTPGLSAPSRTSSTNFPPSRGQDLPDDPVRSARWVLARWAPTMARRRGSKTCTGPTTPRSTWSASSPRRGRTLPVVLVLTYRERGRRAHREPGPPALGSLRGPAWPA